MREVYVKPELVARFYDDDLFQVTTRNSSSVMSATRPSTCSVCGPCCTAFLPESGCVRPASPLWPDVAPAQGNCSAPSSGRNLLNYSLTKIQRDIFTSFTSLLTVQPQHLLLTLSSVIRILTLNSPLQELQPRHR